MQQFLPRFFMLLCAFLLLQAGFAQAPVNDSCSNPLVVLTDVPVTFDNSQATTNGPAHANDCASSGSTPDSTYKDIWYTFTADFTGVARWSLCGGSTNFDTKIFVYGPNSPCPPTDADIHACSEDGGGSCDVVSEIDFDVVNGETYLLRVGGYGDGGPGESGSGDFSITEFIATVANDLCENALPIDTVSGYFFDTSEATTDGPEHPGNSCFQFGDLGASKDIWFTFTPTFSGSVQWSTCDMINFDSRLAIYGPNASCPVTDEDLYACNDDGGGCPNYSSLVFFEVEADSTYILRVGGWSGDSGIGTFDLLRLDPPEPPANDQCENPGEEVYIIERQEADDLNVVFEGTTKNATFNEDTWQFPACWANTTGGGEFADVWYTFDSRTNTEIEIRLNAVTEGSRFYLDIWQDCSNPIDTSVVDGSCLLAEFPGATFVRDTLTGLSGEPTTLYVRVTTRLTSDVPGDFWFQLIGDDFFDPTATTEPDFESFHFFPNPASDQITSSFGLKEDARVSIGIYNTLGQLISREDKGQLAQGKHLFQSRIGQLPPGIYFYMIRVDEQMKTVRFVKE